MLTIFNGFVIDLPSTGEGALNATYVMYRYEVRASNGEALVGKDLLELIFSIAGDGAPYRVSDPTEADYRNFVIDPDVIFIAQKLCAIMDIGYLLDGRLKTEYDRTNNKLSVKWERSTDVRHSRAIFLLDDDIVAFRDGSGDRLTADSAVARFRAILEFHTECEFEYDRTASSADIKKALNRLKVTEFSFDARPFNPHPSKPGDILDKLLQNANVGKLRGVAKSASDEGLSVSDDGLIDEVTGMADKNYANFGMKGETKTGSTVSYKKQRLTGDKQKDREHAEQARNLRVSVPSDDEETSEEEYVVMAIREIFDV